MTKLHAVEFDEEHEAMGIKIHPGYGAPHSSAQAPGAWPNGTRIVKVAVELDDTHKIGDKGVVLGSLGPIPFQGELTYLYFIEWDDMPGLPIGVTSVKLAKEGN